MTQFNVPDMTCGHCVGTITRALKDLDGEARIEISLREHLVKVDSRLAPEALAGAIREAGYTPRAA